MTSEVMEESYGSIPLMQDIIDKADALCEGLRATLDAGLLDMKTAYDLRVLMTALADLRGWIDLEVPA